MIPPENLPGLKPLPDQVKRMRAIRHQRTIPHMRFNLTKKQRRYADFPGTGKKHGSTGTIGPNNYRMDRL